MKAIKRSVGGFLDKYQMALAVYGFFTALIGYFSMYAFRKPFTVIKWNRTLWSIDYKTILVIFQTVGYTLSKFFGIKFVSALGPIGRGIKTFVFVAISLIAWLLFAVVPVPYNFPFILISAFPLGVIWGLIFSFLEGRIITEFITTGMCVSQIIASAYVKSVGSALIEAGVKDIWMPFVVGCIFLIPLGASCFLLELMPPPNKRDIEVCSERQAMNLADQKRFVNAFFPGFVILICSYVVSLVYRDLRDNFAPEMWEELGRSEPSIYTESETIVGCIIIIPIALTLLVKDKSIVFFSSFGFLIIDSVILIIITVVYSLDGLSGYAWIIACGVCLYLVYIPYSTVIFESWLSTFAYPATSGFLMYTADSFGYLLTTIVYLIKALAAPKISWVRFFEFSTYIVFAILIVLKVMGFIYFFFKYDHGNGKLRKIEPVDEVDIVKCDASGRPDNEENKKEEGCISEENKKEGCIVEEDNKALTSDEVKA